MLTFVRQVPQEDEESGEKGDARCDRELSAAATAGCRRRIPTEHTNAIPITNSKSSTIAKSENDDDAASKTGYGHCG